ncbi:pyridoxal-phosphate-dependent aminotransferase family protein [Bermanella marisrubri]|uniref:Serine-pyruvate aminotransferase n=1 Tax=Bermanella marisrubri TaxID=207949 RepID=Q1N5H4_9GAMM|nr:alanine--glyoxylate aminotransferase family protein [Bermanella marisrubri]EAT13968.1 Serine-pyruvate aminotransferase [Oceanobacter sp. RED65] [Bermanella marisrubri]
MTQSIAPPADLPLDSILPDEPLLLMGAGPVPVSQKVATANTVVINHLGDTMNQVIERVRLMAQYVFQTASPHILGVAGPGSAAMEMAITNLVWPGKKVLCIQNGFFSGRLAEMATRCGGDVDILRCEDGEGVKLEQVQQALAEKQYDVLTLVQGETSNTVCNHELADVCKYAHEQGLFTIVDAVCTLSTMPLEMDAWHVDVVITGGQKGLASIPGVSLIAFSERVWPYMMDRDVNMPHWCFDVRLAKQFWEEKGYHYTAPVSGILALHEALRQVCLETLDRRFNRHRLCSQALQQAIEAMGLSLYVEPHSRLNSVVGINLPDGVEGKQLLNTMSQLYKVEISGSFGLPIVRIGQMGEQSRAHNLFRTLHALGMSMKSCGGNVDLPAAMAALERGLDRSSALTA